MGKTADNTRMGEWQRQWEYMTKNGKTPEEFWRNQWLQWRKEKDVESSFGPGSETNSNGEENRKGEKIPEQTQREAKTETDTNIDSMNTKNDFEREFWQLVWEHHKNDKEWKKPEPFMGPRVQEQWGKMMEEGKSSEEFWNSMWEEMKENMPKSDQEKYCGAARRGPPWMNPQLREKWQQMVKDGKSPADFWKTVKDDMHTDGEKHTIFRRFFEKRMNTKMDELIQEGKSPEEFWRKCEGKRQNGRCGWFGSRGPSRNYGDEWKPWMFHYGNMEKGQSGNTPCVRRSGFGQHRCPMSRSSFVRKEYDERPIFREFDF